MFRDLEKHLEKRDELGKAAKKYAGWLILGLAILLFLSVIRSSLFSEVSEEKHIWFELSFLLLAAVSAELLVVYLKQPTVMVLLIVGVLISPSALSLFYPYIAGVIAALLSLAGLSTTIGQSIPRLASTEGMVSVFAQLGAIILLFKIGLHSEIKQIFNTKNFLVAILGIIVPFVAGYYYAIWTGHAFGYAMFLGAALTATSVGVTVAVLQEFKVLETEFAKIILGAAVIDDILALLVLSLIKNIPPTLDASSLAPFAYTIGIAAVFVIGCIKLGQRIVSRYFDKALVGEKIPNNVFLGILAYVLAYAYVAEFIGLSAIVGAFIAGITLNYSRLTNKLFELFYPLEAFFTPVFFISLGMLVDITALSQNLPPIATITVIAILTKLIGCGAAAKISGSTLKDSITVGLGMVPRGEIALIIALYGITATSGGVPVLTPAEYTIIASMAFLTTMITPLALQKAIARKEKISLS
ncbi:MAG: cation:proton antiporter [Candidatus Micrarchaeota archaeon]